MKVNSGKKLFTIISLFTLLESAIFIVLIDHLNNIYINLFLKNILKRIDENLLVEYLSIKK